MDLWTAIGLIVVGIAICLWSLDRVSQLDPEGPGDSCGPYIYPLIVGAVIALAGAFVLAAILISRSLA